MRGHRKLKLVLSLAIMAGLIFVNLSCSSENPADPGDGIPPAEVNAYLAGLPSWTEFCPLEAEYPPTPQGDAVAQPDTTLDAFILGEDESENTLVEDVVYSCQTRTYSLAQNPDKIVIFNPNAHVLYPGALIQGKQHASGDGSMLGLPISQRAPVRVSIPDLPTGANYREIVPNQATVAAAIGEMVGDAVAGDLATPSSIDFKVETYHSEREWALSAGISGRYLGFSASASSSVEQSAATTTISAHFYQRMFTVVVEAPQTPGAFFSEDFTKEQLQVQIDMGRIGPDNIPVYVADVVYGRMMMFTMTSTASADEMKSTINTAYENLFGDISASLTTRQRNILRNSQMTVASIGGPANATTAVIQSGNWRDYFTVEAALSTATPISYTLVNLGDGSIADVTETSTYHIRECTAGTGTFSFGGDDEEDFLRPKIPPDTPYKEYNFLYPLIRGDCEFGGYPILHDVILMPLVTDDEIALVPLWQIDGEIGFCLGSAEREGDDSYGEIGFDSIIYAPPPGWRIVSVGGMSPSAWMEYASCSLQDLPAYNGINTTFTRLGNAFEGRLIGDLGGHDFVTCNIINNQTPTGIYALKIEETVVELECIDCD